MMFTVEIGGDMETLVRALDGMIDGLSDLRPLADAIGVVMVDDNRAARLAGVDRYDAGLAPLRGGRPLRPSELRARGGDGPPLAPRGAASRVVADFTIDVEPAGPMAYVVRGRWPSMPFIGFHVEGRGFNPERDVAGVRDAAGVRMGEAARAFGEAAMAAGGGG